MAKKWGKFGRFVGIRIAVSTADEYARRAAVLGTSASVLMREALEAGLTRPTIVERGPGWRRRAGVGADCGIMGVEGEAKA